MPQSRWLDYYRRYRTLKSRWRIPGLPPKVEASSVLWQVLRSSGPARKHIEKFVKWGSGEPTRENWEEALELRGVVGSLPAGWSEREPLEDVYQAALRMEMYPGEWDGSVKRYLFRGQRDHTWDMIPSMYRTGKVEDGTGEAVAADPEVKLERICELVRSMQANGMTIAEDEEKAVAVVQHYSSPNELGVGTWLIDYTWDPFIALFFASRRGMNGDIGVVSYVSPTEWAKMSVDGTNRMGALRVIDPDGVPRIAAQRAAFIDTSHPELLRLYVPHSLYFRQTTGMVFEDVERNPPVAERDLYPSPDELLQRLKCLPPVLEPKPLSCGPGADPRSPLDADDFMKMVSSWCSRDGVALTVDQQRLLVQVCDMFARMQEPSAVARIPITSRSLRSLESMVNGVTKFSLTTAAAVIQLALDRCITDTGRRTIQQLANTEN